jgi:hypothetical protein
MRFRPSFIALLLLLLLAINFTAVQAQENCVTRYVDGQFVTICFGSGGEEPPPSSCTPGAHLAFIVLEVIGPGECIGVPIYVDNCTGEVLGYASQQPGTFACNLSTQENPCVIFQAGAGGITCGTEWLVSASVGYPETFLDLRPYPASLVRWPTAARCSALPPAAGSGSLAYYSPSGGSPDDPAPGDWRNLTLTLDLEPAGPMFLSLPQIGELALPPVGEAGPPFLFEWEIPSHPAAGGSLLAGEVPGLAGLPEEVLPADIPLFVGQARSPYRLFWHLDYEAYVERQRNECVAGPNGAGAFECRTATQLLVDDGHWEVVRYDEWEARQRGGEVQPAAVQGLPPQLAADLNQDGIPDAFWNNNVTLRRMDETGRVDNPEWAASWNWGGTVYWAVREAQGQVGWP